MSLKTLECAVEKKPFTVVGHTKEGEWLIKEVATGIVRPCGEWGLTLGHMHLIDKNEATRRGE